MDEFHQPRYIYCFDQCSCPDGATAIGVVCMCVTCVRTIAFQRNNCSAVDRTSMSVRPPCEVSWFKRWGGNKLIDGLHIFPAEALGNKKLVLTTLNTFTTCH